MLSRPAFRSSRPFARLLLASIAFSTSSVALVPVAAHAQSQLIQPAQTKQEAEAAQKAADKAAAAQDSGGGVPLVVWMGVGALLVIGGATFYILRDASGAVAPTDSRGRARPVDPGAVRGAPKTMFTGEGAPGGQTKRQKNRAKTKRQKAARRNNR